MNLSVSDLNGSHLIIIVIDLSGCQVTKINPCCKFDPPTEYCPQRGTPEYADKGQCCDRNEVI